MQFDTELLVAVKLPSSFGESISNTQESDERKAISLKKSEKFTGFTSHKI